MKFHFRNIDYVTPPGTLVEILAQPSGRGSAVELAVFAEHRFAFFFWTKWTNKLIKEVRINHPPALVTLDWHQDFIFPTKTEKAWLRSLDIKNNKDVSLFSWANLRPLNDDHIMSAAYLNQIGNTYVLCRQGEGKDWWVDEKLKDRFGNIHLIKKFKEYDELEAHMIKSNEQNVYFDIDLDFFTINNPYNGVGKEFTYLTDRLIRDMLRIDRPLIQWIFERMQGFTIATEPKHTGGLFHSNKFLGLIDNIYFQPSLFTTYGENWRKSCRWKHLDWE